MLPRKFRVLASVLLLSFLLCSCQSPAQDHASGSSSSSSAADSVPAPKPTETPSSQETSSEKSEESAAENSAAEDNSCFEGAAFIGNSLLEDLNVYAIIDNADFYAKTGLTVSTVFKESTVDGTIPIMDEVTGKDYEKIFLVFGLNELGWSNPSAFTDKYEEVIDTLRKKEPDATLYVQSLFPVSKKRSDQDLYGVTNERIVEYNKMLKKLAKEKKVIYLDVYSKVVTPDGDLEASASNDGVHPNMEYCKIWVQCLRELLAEDAADEK